jgi:hypothetical protein
MLPAPISLQVQAEAVFRTRLSRLPVLPRAVSGCMR